VTNDHDDVILRQLARLDEIERHAQELLDAPHYHMRDGKPVLDPATGEPLRDDGPVLHRIDVMLGAASDRGQLSEMAVTISGPLRLTHYDRHTRTRQALAQMARGFGFDHVSDNW
jgi:hypothetical protein